MRILTSVSGRTEKRKQQIHIGMLSVTFLDF